ncbi:phage tail fiber protein [Candidatus Pelagibacter communis]|uniref:phage tail fiber domain-containing protein n=1 Tax=Pelagibacter ubique TaxID=198252 RepID=UPI00094CDBA8|nr:phage tail fiber protein [Candidatus Pelagibacter ubique]
MSFLARVSYTANGNTNTFSFSFPYILTSHVKAYVDGVEDTSITFPTASSVQLSSTPANGAVVLIQRITPSDARLVDFQDGSVLTSSDLDQSADQNFFLSQETSDNVQSKLGLNASDRFDALNKRIINLANPVDNQDAVTKHYLENTWLSSSDKANITTLAGISNLGTLANNETNINTVATNISSVNTVATNITKVVAVADDLAEAVSEVVTVADDLNEATSEIDVVANNITNVNAVGNNITNVNSVATNSTNINLVAGSITNVNNVGGSIANVNTVSSNLASVNNFGEKYKISASAPSSPTEGMLWYDTQNDIMKVYSGSAFANAGSSVNGTSGRFKYIATANQTTFTGASHSDTGSAVLTYDSGFIDIFKNGVHLDPSDYTATDGSTIVLDVGCSVNDEIYVLTFGTFNVASISANSITSDVLATARGGTGLGSIGTAGQVLKVNSSANALEYGNASSAEVYGFETYYNGSTLVKTVTVQSVGGSNKYFIDGVQQDTLELYEGNTYVFNHPSAHPFRFSTDSGNSNAYTTGVTVNSSTQVTIVVATGAPTLYYYCSSHSGMGGQANTPVPAVNNLRIITTNQGVDNISSSQYASFDDVMFSASGFVFSISNGELIATI